MTLQSSGTISLGDLRREYTNLGSNGTVSLSDFYYGSTFVKKNTCTDFAKASSDHPTKNSHFPNIQTSKSNIKLSNYYGKTYYYAHNTTLQPSGSNASVNTTNIENSAIKKGQENTVFYDVIINSDCYASSTSNFGLTITAGNIANTTCFLNNSSRIYGKGGAGGPGNAENGSSGGPALQIHINTFLYNNGRILGGGGGGGGGGQKLQSYNRCYCCTTGSAGISGGGGGGGKGNGPGGPSGRIPEDRNTERRTPGGDGATGDTENTGRGGGGGSVCVDVRYLGTQCSNPGGTGGGWAEAGDGAGGGGGGGGGGGSISRKNGKYYNVILGGTRAGAESTF
jgi:hypothetical protein